MWNLFQITVWRTTFRCPRLIRSNRYSSNEEVSGVFSSSQCITTLLKKKDLVFRLPEQQKCHFVTSSCKLSRSADFTFAKKPKSKEPSGPRPAGRVSSELQKLGLEELTLAESQGHHKGTLKVKAPHIHLREGKKHDMVFGVAPCILALSQGRRKATQLFVKISEGPQRKAVQKVCEEAHRRDVLIQHVRKRELDIMTGGMVHQGVCLQASPLGFVMEKKSSRPQYGDHPLPLWLVLDGVQDPMNLGSILRSAYFLGVDRVASSIQNSCPLSPVVSKASSGVMELMQVYGYNNLADLIKVKLEQGWQVAGTVGSDETSSGTSVMSCSDFRISKPTLLLMGGEGFGLSPELRQLCDVLLTIPPRRELHPAVDSLNVSVATGILLHCLLSSRRVS